MLNGYNLFFIENDYNTPMKKALFLDRDGVINIDSGYVYKKEDFIFIDGIFEALQFYQSLGYLLVVITNQSGINRGYYTCKDFLELCEFMNGEFCKHGLHVSKIYHCPHRPDEACECRKPKPFMIFQAQEEFNIDLSQSIMIGDKVSDMQAGFNAGVKKLFLIGEKREDFYENVQSVFDTIRLFKEKV